MLLKDKTVVIFGGSGAGLERRTVAGWCGARHDAAAVADARADSRGHHLSRLTIGGGDDRHGG